MRLWILMAVGMLGVMISIVAFVPFEVTKPAFYEGERDKLVEPVPSIGRPDTAPQTSIGTSASILTLAVVVPYEVASRAHERLVDLEIFAPDGALLSGSLQVPVLLTGPYEVWGARVHYPFAQVSVPTDLHAALQAVPFVYGTLASEALDNSPVEADPNATGPSDQDGKPVSVTGQEHPLQAVLDQLSAADLAFNRPSEMTVGEVVSIELVLSPQSVSGLATVPETASVEDRAEAVGLSEDLVGATQVVSGVRYGPQMQAELSGIDFEISPSGPQAKTVLPDQSVTWVWSVKPKAPGDAQILTLGVSALLKADGIDLPPVEIRTFTERFPVRITFWGRVVQVSSELKAVHGAVAAVGGTLVAIGLWFWKRRQKPVAKAPLEVVLTQRRDG